MKVAIMPGVHSKSRGVRSAAILGHQQVTDLFWQKIDTSQMLMMALEKALRHDCICYSSFAHSEASTLPGPA